MTKTTLSLPIFRYYEKSIIEQEIEEKRKGPNRPKWQETKHSIREARYRLSLRSESVEGGSLKTNISNNGTLNGGSMANNNSKRSCSTTQSLINIKFLTPRSNSNSGGVEGDLTGSSRKLTKSGELVSHGSEDGAISPSVRASLAAANTKFLNTSTASVSRSTSTLTPSHLTETLANPDGGGVKQTTFTYLP